MDEREAERLIAAAVAPGPGMWADLGAGEGTFTRALAARLGHGARIYAVDRDARALKKLKRGLASPEIDIRIVEADLTHALDLPDSTPGALDGMLIANALHFLPDGAGALGRLARWLHPDGCVVLIEYDQRSRSRWVPYPVPAEDVAAVFAAAMLTPPQIVARMDSAFGGEMYVAVGRKR